MNGADILQLFAYLLPAVVTGVIAFYFFRLHTQNEDGRRRFLLHKNSQKEMVLRMNSWNLDIGERVFVQGPSGSGKSTLLNILCGILPTPEGEVSILDQRLDQMGARQRDRFRADHIGYVFQQFNLIPYLSVIDNVRLARSFSRAHSKSSTEGNTNIDQLLESLNIDSQYWQKQARALSIGQQQRVAIARAFVNNPKLLIVDEPTSSLDHNNRDNFMSLLMDKVAETNATLVFVSHDQSLSSYFQRIDSMQDLNALSADA